MNEEISGEPVHLKAESVHLKSAVAFRLYMKAAEIEKFRADFMAQVPPPEHYCDVQIDIDGRKAEMTWDEFTHRLFMELPA